MYYDIVWISFARALETKNTSTLENSPKRLKNGVFNYCMIYGLQFQNTLQVYITNYKLTDFKSRSELFWQLKFRKQSLQKTKNSSMKQFQSNAYNKSSPQKNKIFKDAYKIWCHFKVSILILFSLRLAVIHAKLSPLWHWNLFIHCLKKLDQGT